MARKFFWIIGLIVMLSVVAPYSTKAAVDELGAQDFSFNLRPITNEHLPVEKYAKEGVNYVIRRVMTLAAGTIGGIAVLGFSAGGFLMLTSGGDETALGKAKTMMKYSLLGLVFTLSAYVLVILVQTLVTSIFSQY